MIIIVASHPALLRHAPHCCITPCAATSRTALLRHAPHRYVTHRIATSRTTSLCHAPFRYVTHRTATALRHAPHHYVTPCIRTSRTPYSCHEPHHSNVTPRYATPFFEALLITLMHTTSTLWYVIFTSATAIHNLLCSINSSRDCIDILLLLFMYINDAL